MIRRQFIAGAFALLACSIAADTALAGDTVPQRLLTLEQAVASDSENLILAAEYRQVIIETAQFDRAIDFFRRIVKSRNGANVQLSLALSYVDKVPTSGDLKRLYLGRDAMSALTKSIEQRPTVLAYFLRGVINLYYNRSIFNRTDKGVADLTEALKLTNSETPPLLAARAQRALGDGYFRLGQLAKAREVWSAAAIQNPDDTALQDRLHHDGQQLEWIVGAALAAEHRVDTSLAGLLPAH
jgi:tetratricopeptide (TPR) repeat protein